MFAYNWTEGLFLCIIGFTPKDQTVIHPSSPGADSDHLHRQMGARDPRLQHTDPHKRRLDIQSGRDGHKEIFNRNWPGLFGCGFFLLAVCAMRFALCTLRPGSHFLKELNKTFPSNNRRVDHFDISYQNFKSLTTSLTPSQSDCRFLGV